MKNRRSRAVRFLSMTVCIALLAGISPGSGTTQTKGAAAAKNAAAGSQALSLRLEFPKRDYVTGEPVFARTSLHNLGDSAIRVRRLYLPFGYFKLLVKNSAGKEFPFGFKLSASPDPALQSKLEPHDSESVVFDLLPLYASGDQALRKYHSMTFFVPGSYTVRATLETGHGKTVSPPVAFTVRKPSGKDAVAFGLLGAAAKLESGGQKAPAEQALDSLIRIFPESAYHVQAYMQKMFLYEQDEAAASQRTACGAALSLIHAHPESDAATAALSYYMIHGDQIGLSRDNLRDTLLTILQRHPDTRAAREAYKAIKTFEAAGRVIAH